MQTSWAPSMDLLLGFEGGFAMLAGDEMTNLGVKKSVWEDWVERTVDTKEMRSLTRMDVEPLYKANYWNACRCNDIPAPLDTAVFDFAVNSGPFRAATTLQELVGVKQDGKIGVLTLNAMGKIPLPGLLKNYLEARRQYLKGLRNFALYGKGWLNRVDQLEHWCMEHMNEDLPPSDGTNTEQ